MSEAASVETPLETLQKLTLKAKEPATSNNDNLTEQTKEQPTISPTTSRMVQNNKVLSEDQSKAMEGLTDIEKQAYLMGWRKKHEFKGNPDDWLEAKEFTGRSNLYKKIDTLKKEQDGFKQENEKLQKSILKLVERLDARETRNEKLDLDEKLKKLEEEKLNAYTNGSIDDAKKYEEEYYKYKAAQDKINDSIPNKQPDPKDGNKIDPDTLEFIGRNKAWFNSKSVQNEKMMNFAVGMYQRLEQEMPDISTKRRFEEVEIHTRRCFPEYFENANQNNPQMVLSGDNYSQNNFDSKAVSYNNMPQYVKDVIDAFAETNPRLVEKNPNFKNEYAQKLVADGKVPI